MRHCLTLSPTKAFVASLVGALILVLPTVGEKAALAQPVHEVAAMEQGPLPLRPGEAHPGFTLPPLSDHVNVAELSDDEAALEEDDVATAEMPSQQYDNEPAQIEIVMLVPDAGSATDISEIGEDGTARQYNRGYYKDPEVTVALIIVTGEEMDE